MLRDELTMQKNDDIVNIRVVNFIHCNKSEEFVNEQYYD